MASPPYRSPATSPPYPPHTTLPNPRKRPPLQLASGPPSIKRRKPSSFSTSATSAHPLRQTSFPPEESALANGTRSPSVESDFTGITGGQSVVTAGTGGKKGKGRRKKVNGSIKSGANGATDGRSRTGQAEEDGAEEEEDDEGDDGVVDGGGPADIEAEKKNLAILLDAFDSDQANRYAMYRRAKLRKETVRKISNQTLSQSVPPSVITTITGFCKVFLGTMIERSRDVREQFAEHEKPSPSDPPNNETLPRVNGEFEEDTSFGADGFPNETTQSVSSQPRRKSQQLGPLTPDHIREALRRYKRNGEGGGSGFAGLSLELGLPGAAVARLGGKRLFR